MDDVGTLLWGGPHLVELEHRNAVLLGEAVLRGAPQEHHKRDAATTQRRQQPLQHGAVLHDGTAAASGARDELQLGGAGGGAADGVDGAAEHHGLVGDEPASGVVGVVADDVPGGDAEGREASRAAEHELVELAACIPRCCAAQPTAIYSRVLYCSPHAASLSQDLGMRA